MKSIKLTTMSLALLTSSSLIMANESFITKDSSATAMDQSIKIANSSTDSNLSTDLLKKLSTLDNNQKIVVIITIQAESANSAKGLLDQYAVAYQSLLEVPTAPGSTKKIASVELSKINILKLKKINSIESVSLPTQTSTNSSLSNHNFQSFRKNYTRFTERENDGVHFKTDFTGKGITIAVIDSGINSNHPQLKNNVIAHYCFSSYLDQGTTNKTCPDNYQGQNNLDSHGTHVAGIIGAQPLKGGAPVGVAPNVKLVNMRVTHSGGVSGDFITALSTLNSDPKLSRVKIVNMSMYISLSKYSGKCDSRLQDNDEKTIKGWIDYLTEVKGVQFIAAAGNDSLEGYESFPACLENVISVSNNHHKNYTSEDETFFEKNTLVHDSNISSETTIAAPGHKISSTNNFFKENDLTTYAVSLSGTSMAAPAVSACIALMLEKKPDLTPRLAKEILTRSTAFQARRQNDHDYSVPVLDCESALFLTF